MKTKLIYNMDDNVWRKMRTLAVSRDIKMAVLIQEIFEFYMKNKGEK